MHIFLIRHGESISNNGSNYVKRIPDHLIPLSEVGKIQAHEAGIWLANYCKEQGLCLDNARIWRSPYCRTRQTSEEFNASLGITDIREDITLQQKTSQRIVKFFEFPIVLLEIWQNFCRVGGLKTK